MKDFNDLWSPPTRSAFDGPVLARAPGATFRRRQTALPTSPVALTGRPGGPPVSVVIRYALCPLPQIPPIVYNEFYKFSANSGS
jgi:hypothetical protein